jgi:hypothetical protein
MLDWVQRVAENSSADMTMVGLASVGVIACAFSLDWIRQFWNSPRDLSFMAEFIGGLEYDGRQLGFRQSLPIGLVALLLTCSAILISELGGPILISGVLLLATAPAWLLTLVVWLFGRPTFLVIPALRGRKVKDLD